MLGKILGKVQKSALSKNQIEVVCPVCGAVQAEPRLVVTTHCRKCREHLRIVGGKVLASSHLNPVPSSVFPAMLDSHPEVGVVKAYQGAHAPGDEAAEEVEAVTPAPEVESSDEILGMGRMLGLAESKSDAGSESASHPEHPPVMRTSAPRRSVTLPPRPAEPASAAQPPMSPSTMQRMKEQGYYRQQYFKDVECFDCQNKFKTGRSARSTHCPTCGSLICLEDVDINVAYTTPIRTRGDVLIRRNGNVNTSDIKCRDLKVQGHVTARIECSGELQLKTSGTIIGEIHCRKLLVDRGSDINFVNSIFAEEVEIQARVEGNIQCTGRVVITSQGSVHGDVTARSVSIEPGGHLDGAMNILRAAFTKPATPDPSPATNGKNGYHGYDNGNGNGNGNGSHGNSNGNGHSHSHSNGNGNGNGNGRSANGSKKGHLDDNPELPLS